MSADALFTSKGAHTHTQGGIHTLSHTCYITKGRVHELGSSVGAEPQRKCANVHMSTSSTDQYDVSCK